MKRLVIALAARRDFKAIQRYTEQQWGPRQRQRYKAALRDGLFRLRREPRAGRSRDDLGLGYRSLLVGQHVVFYRDAGEFLEVVRVLHQRMDPRRHLIGPA